MNSFGIKRLILIAALTSPFSFSAIVSAQDELEDRIRELANPYVESGTVVGLSIGVIKDGKAITVHVGAIEKDGPVANDKTVYEIGSISKVFTGVLLADAVENGTVTLEQTAQSLLPVDVTMPKWEDREITLLDLATHRSGLPRLSDNMPSLNSNNPYSDYTSKLAHEFLNEHKLARKPGSKTEYSNLGASLLGHLISSTSGKSYDELLQQQISKPLGMNETRVALTDSMRQRLATPHDVSGSKGHNWDFADMPGAGGIRSTISDMLTFAKANLETPEGKLGDALNLAWKKHRRGNPSLGLCWHLAGDGSTRWHNGQTGGYHSMMLVNRKLNIAAVLLCNSATMEVDQLAQQIFQMLAGQRVKPRIFEEKVEVAEEVMQRYVGKYELAANFVFSVSVKDGNLMVGLTGQPTHRVYAKSETEWFYKVVDAQITFKVDKDGKCDALVLHQNGMDQTAKRK